MRTLILLLLSSTAHATIDGGGTASHNVLTGDPADVIIDSSGKVGTVQVADGDKFFGSYKDIADGSFTTRGLEFTNNSMNINEYSIEALRYYNGQYVNSFKTKVGYYDNNDYGNFGGSGEGGGGDHVTVNTKKCNKDGGNVVNDYPQFEIDATASYLTVNNYSSALTLTKFQIMAEVNCFNSIQAIINNHLDMTVNMEKDNQLVTIQGTGVDELFVNCNKTNPVINLTHGADLSGIMIDGKNNPVSVISNSNKKTIFKKSGNTIGTFNLSFSNAQPRTVEFFDFFPTTKLTLANAGNDGENIKTRLSDLGASAGTFNFGVFLSKINLLLNYNDANTKTLAFDTFPANGIFLKNESNASKNVFLELENPDEGYKYTTDGGDFKNPVDIEANQTVLIGMAAVPPPEPVEEPVTEEEPPIQQDPPKDDVVTGSDVIDNLPADTKDEILSLPVEIQGSLTEALSSPEAQAVFGAMLSISPGDSLPSAEMLVAFASVPADNLAAISGDASMVAIIQDVSLMSALSTITPAQLADFKLLSPAEKVKFLRNIANTAAVLDVKRFNKIKSFKEQQISFKDRMWEIINISLDENHCKMYNNINTDIRKLFYMNSAALMKFQTLSKQEVYKFEKMSPIGQLDYTLMNFPITYVKRDMKPIIEQRMNILGRDQDFKVKNLRNQINQLEEQGVQIKGVQIKGANLNQLNTQKTKEQNYSSQKKRLNFIFLK